MFESQPRHPLILAPSLYPRALRDKAIAWTCQYKYVRTMSSLSLRTLHLNLTPARGMMQFACEWNVRSRRTDGQ